MNPFNLEEAKAGKPVQTRNGMSARILSFDIKSRSSIVYAVSDTENVGECVYMCNNDGKYYGGATSSFDLFMAPVVKEYWANVYRTNSGGIDVSIKYYSSEEEAKKCATTVRYITSVLVYKEEI